MAERSTIAVWAVAAALAVLAGWRLLGGTGGEAPPPVRLDAGGAAAPGSTSARTGGTPAETLYVHVAGAVRQPGLLRIREGARVATALARAGGPTRRADLTLVNLASKLRDGQQIVVPVRGAAGAPAGGGATPAPGAPIHLSTATMEQLEEIDGIGPTLAERIIEYRDANGGVGSIDELAEVDGIGEKRLATLREALQP